MPSKPILEQLEAFGMNKASTPSSFISSQTMSTQLEKEAEEVQGALVEEQEKVLAQR